MQAEENKIIEFTLLFSKHKRRVYNYALKMLGDKMHADDVVQDVFIKLFEHLNTIQNKQSVQFWLFKTARNEILSFYRSTKNKKLITNSVDMNEIEIESPLLLADEIENKELSKLILNELDLMNEDFKEVFVLKEYSGLSYKEIASLLDIDDELVKSRLYKARQKLVNKISKLIE
ncbi:MAG TPA: RNA polymerase sigma factor [Ignavibacteriaceae bacterium]|nr:RNA polymerase sigma factor [Ignavibacteriaceae bacterium]